MRVLLTRSGTGAETQRRRCRVYVPFTEISLERQALIAMHSDYGHRAGLLARLSDVIAPIAHLEAKPGLEKYHLAKLVDGVAGRVAGILLRRAFPEIAEPIVPFGFDMPSAPLEALRFGTIENISGRYETLLRVIDHLTPAGLSFRIESDR